MIERESLYAWALYVHEKVRGIDEVGHLSQKI